tara:strand:- start:63 stop:596 length:534 start_codon:yes stop_codon:yes gene_type:complete
VPFCRECGKEIQEDFTFCPHCGSDFSTKSSADASDVKKSIQNLVVIMILFLILFYPYGPLKLTNVERGWKVNCDAFEDTYHVNEMGEELGSDDRQKCINNVQNPARELVIFSSVVAIFILYSINRKEKHNSENSVEEIGRNEEAESAQVDEQGSWLLTVIICLFLISGTLLFYASNY